MVKTAKQLEKNRRCAHCFYWDFTCERKDPEHGWSKPCPKFLPGVGRCEHGWYARKCPVCGTEITKFK